ncbi:helix-turn-helix domain-containing protein [Providencia burhodogranariea]|uniref:Fimbrial operon regulator n=1 Tax=Providencia burhodogranariea DSM 19968 TaxID=1141662 RepID=K8WB61_9GAMM|nr:helix-turn-helix transcriptional regulator [Providencia burhodogranariea]EKT57156.1 fimbrial operon regulator [Providencia burhodogranariea DSM 19968]
MHKNISKTVGLKIRILRERHGMTGKELSLLLGISQQHQSRYENGDVNIHVETIYYLTQIFDIKPDYFFSESILTNENNIQINKSKTYYQAETII